MKKCSSLTKPLLLLIMLLVFPTKNNAQGKELNCYQKTLKANRMFAEKEDKADIIKLLSPCVQSKYADAMYLMGSVILEGKPSKQDQQKAYSLIQKAAEQDHPEASSALGLIYTKGIGSEANKKNALQWYKKAAELGNNKAIYMLGYFNFKGIYGVEQDYQKAVDLFQKSNHPMAKHWLAICNYYGYGIEKDQEKAIQLLEENAIINSETLVKQFTANKGETLQAIENPEIVPNEKLIGQRFNPTGSYTGNLLEYDYSGQKVLRTIPVKIDLELLKKKHQISYAITINNQEKQGVAEFSNNTLTFEDLSISLQRLLNDNPFKPYVDYKLHSMSISEQKKSGKNHVIGEIEASIVQWNELAAPIKLIVEKDKNSNAFWADAFKAFDSQKNSFIKLHPNPFKENLFVQYTLDNPSNIQIQLRDFSGITQKIIQKGKSETAGQHRFMINGSDLKKGIYIISITVNGSEHTKTIIKK